MPQILLSYVRCLQLHYELNPGRINSETFGAVPSETQVVYSRPLLYGKELKEGILLALLAIARPRKRERERDLPLHSNPSVPAVISLFNTK